MPGNEESVAAQGFKEMKSPLFEKSVRKADFIHVFLLLRNKTCLNNVHPNYPYH